MVNWIINNLQEHSIRELLVFGWDVENKLFCISKETSFIMSSISNCPVPEKAFFRYFLLSCSQNQFLNLYDCKHKSLCFSVAENKKYVSGKVLVARLADYKNLRGIN
jgi:hypothetical protein